jgi:hypothetical protein
MIRCSTTLPVRFSWSSKPRAAALREEVERGGGILLPAPAVRVDRALAVAAAARVVDEHAV